MVRQTTKQPAGKRRHRITFESQNDTRDATYGSNELEAEDFATVWADIMPISGRETLGPDRVDAETTHFIECQYLAGVTEKMRIRFGERHFDIISVLNVEERNIKYEIQAAEQK